MSEAVAEREKLTPWGPNLVLPIDIDSDDGRRFTGDMEIGRIPLPFRYREAEQDKHDGAVVVGRVLGAERRADGIWAWGDVFDPSTFTGQHADRIRSALNLLGKKVGQVSADIAAMPIRVGGRAMHTNGLLKGVTMVGLPAFDSARVELSSETTEAGARTPVAAAFTADLAYEVADGDSLRITYGTVQVVGEEQIEPCCVCEGACPIDGLNGLDGLAGLKSLEEIPEEIPEFYPLASDVERVSCSVTGDTTLPIAEQGSAIDTSWDGGKAEAEIFRWADTGDGPDPERLAKAFLYRDPSKNPKTKWAWKLPIARPVAGELRIIPKAVFSASTVLNGGRSGVDVPAGELATIRGKVEKLYRRMGIKPPDERNNRRVVEKLSDEAIQALSVETDVNTVEVCTHCTTEADTMMSDELVALNARLDEFVASTMNTATNPAIEE